MKMLRVIRGKIKFSIIENRKKDEDQNKFNSFYFFR